MSRPKRWPDREILAAGQIMCSLVLDSRSWMHRRVERLSMDERGSTRLQVSLDYTLPLELPGSEQKVLLPLGLVRKGALASLNTSGPDGKPAPVLETMENGRLASAMLFWMAFQVIPDVLHDKRLWRHLEHVALGSPEDAEFAYLRYLAWRRARPQIPGGEALDTFESVMLQLARNFLLVIEVPQDSVGTRSIAKYSYEHERPRVTSRDLPVTVGTEASQFGLARSWHFEVEAPTGLGVRRLVVAEVEAGEPTGEVWVDDTSSAEPLLVAHTACRASSRFTTARVYITLTPLPRGVPWVSAVGALVTLVVAAGMVLERHGVIDLLESNPTGTSPAASILLAGPALLLSWLARGPEHVLVARLLRPVRRPLVWTTGTLFAGAVLVAAPFKPEWATAGWITLAVLQSIPTWMAVRWLRVVSGRTYGADNEEEEGQ